jgi:hypothetical protein
MSIKNSNGAIGNRTRDLPVCSPVPQLTAPPAACPHVCQTKLCHILQVNKGVNKQGPDSSVGNGTRYGLEGTGIEFRWVARFSALVQTVPGAHPASYKIGTGSLPSVKQPERGVDHPSPSIARVKERVELYLYSPSGPS